MERWRWDKLASGGKSNGEVIKKREKECRDKMWKLERKERQ